MEIYGYIPWIGNFFELGKNENLRSFPENYSEQFFLLSDVFLQAGRGGGKAPTIDQQTRKGSLLLFKGRKDHQLFSMRELSNITWCIKMLVADRCSQSRNKPNLT